MVRHELLVDSTAVIVVDMMNEFLEPGAIFECQTGRAMVPLLSELLDICRSRKVPVIYTQMLHRADGSDWGWTARLGRAREAIHIEGTHEVAFYPAVAPQAGDIVISKRRFSAFYATELDLILRRLGVNTLVITGVTSHVCCISTIRDALYRDYKVIYPQDLNECNDLPSVDGRLIPRQQVQDVIAGLIALMCGEVTDGESLIRRVADAPRYLSELGR